MQSKIPVHDHDMYTYVVDCEVRRIVLYTVGTYCTPYRYVTVSFHNVLAHHFEHVQPGNILSDITEVDPAVIVRDNAKLFADSYQHGWPHVGIDWKGNLEVLVSAIRSASHRGYQITSSYGMSGWVIAGSCEHESREMKPIQ